MGLVTPIGVGIQENWSNMLAGKSGIVTVSGDPEFKGLKSQIGGRLPKHFNIDKHKTNVSKLSLRAKSLEMRESSVWRMPSPRRLYKMRA